MTSFCEWPTCLGGAMTRPGGTPACRHDPTAARCPLLAAPNTTTPSRDDTPDTLLGIATPDDED